MTTNAWACMQARKDIAVAEEITRDEAITAIKRGEKIPTHRWTAEADIADANVKATGEHTYLADVAAELCRVLGIESPTEDQLRTAETLCYGANRVRRARATLEKYERMMADGWVPFHDITEADNGKEALLTGTSSLDWMTVKKDAEPVVLVVLTDGRKGYRRPRMRTRFFSVAMDADYFVQIKQKMCANCKTSPVYAEGEDFCNDCWYSASFESEV